MFPLRDTVRTYKYPIISILLIVLNVFVFFVELFAPDTEAFIRTYALVPAKVNFSKIYTLTPFVSSQFLHAGIVHIASNMWFLKIFGDNVEEEFGSTFYLFVYLLSGIVGGLSQYFISTSSDIPMLGASGAVAGVLGAYLVFFPRHQIETIIPFGFYVSTVKISASIMLIYWFITQFFSGVGSVAIAQTGGVAFWAHIGGFATGFIIARIFKSRNNENEVNFEGYDYLN